jgi:hypothetical protein
MRRFAAFGILAALVVVSGGATSSAWVARARNTTDPFFRDYAVCTDGITYDLGSRQQWAAEGRTEPSQTLREHVVVTTAKGISGPTGLTVPAGNRLLGREHTDTLVTPGDPREPRLIGRAGNRDLTGDATTAVLLIPEIVTVPWSQPVAVGATVYVFLEGSFNPVEDSGTSGYIADLPRHRRNWASVIELTVADCTVLLPARLADTRSTGLTVDGLFQAGGPLTADSTLELTVAGRAGIPLDAEAVTLNVTSVGASGGGFVVARPCGVTLPTAASLNLAPGQAAANLVITPLGAGGKVCLYTSAATQLIVDVAGVFPAGSPITPLSPQRMLDRRPGSVTVDGQFRGGGVLAAGTPFELQLGGRAGVPANAEAAVLNIAVVAPGANGFVKSYPCSGTAPNAASINYVAGQTRASQTIVGVDAAGKVCLLSSQDVLVVADLAGFFDAASAYEPLTPARLLETRPGQSTVDGLFQGSGALAAGSTLALTVKGRGGVGAAARSVVLNVAATGAGQNGYVTAFSCGGAPPNSATVNFRPNAAVNNHTVVRLGVNDQVCLFASSSVQLIADVVGYQP